MKVTNVEKLEKSHVALTIAADAQEFESALERVYKKERGRIMIPGFRKGHAPRKIIESMYGAEVFYEDAINEAYPDLYAQAVEQEGLDTVAYPKVELEKADKDGFTFKATVAVRPEVKLGKYKGLTAPRDVEKVTAKDIDTELQPYIDRATRLVEVERKAKKGDTVTIDFEGFKDGVAFEGGKGENYDLELGSGSFIPGFEDQLVGAKAGSETEVNVTFPAEYGATELAGKDATFKVKVNAVKEKALPELDDEFAKDVSEFETLAELRADLESKIAERRETAARRAFEDNLMEQVAEGIEADIPDEMVEVRCDQMLEDYAQRITDQGIPFEQYLSMTGLTTEILRQQAMEGALRQVKTDLALKAIAAAEKIQVTEEEMDAELQRLADQHGMKFDQVKKIVPEEEIRSDLLNQKAAQVVFDSAKAGKTPAKKAAKKEEKTGEKEEKKEAKTEKKTAKKTAKKAETEAAPAEEKPKKATRKKKTEE